MFDFAKFFQASTDNAPWVLAVVLGLVTLFGKFGVTGKVQLAVALLTGVVIGGSFDVAALGVPKDFAGWFSCSMYGLAMGLTATLGYETGKSLVTKVVTKALVGGDETLGKE